MDVDTPNVLKRCSSAPLINEVASTAATSPTTNTAPRSISSFSMFSNSSLPRTRSNSISCSSMSTAINLPGSFKSTCARQQTLRVKQLRQEEGADGVIQREVAHEREVHTAMQMGQSCEDLTLMPAKSPTRIPRFPPVVSPSTTRKFTTRRSLSPIALRASSFSPTGRAAAGKRRGEDACCPRAKRACPGQPSPPTPPTPDSDSPDCTFRPVSPRRGDHCGDHRGDHCGDHRGAHCGPHCGDHHGPS